MIIRIHPDTCIRPSAPSFPFSNSQTSRIMSSDKKRQLTEDNVEEKKKPARVRIVAEGLCKLMGGVKLCREEELTRAMLLEFLKSRGEKSKR